MVTRVSDTLNDLMVNFLVQCAEILIGLASCVKLVVQQQTGDRNWKGTPKNTNIVINQETWHAARQVWQPLAL